MAFKLTKDKLKQRDEKIEALREAGEKLKEAVEAANVEIAGIREKLEPLVDEYNAKITEAVEFVNELGEEFRGEFDDKSERWQEGDKGSEVNDWIETFESFALEEISLSLPDDIEEPDVGHTEELESLNESP